FSAVVLNAGNNPIPNPYQDYFNEAYALYPAIPRGVLEGVSFTNTRFTHLTGEEEPSCTGMPQAVTVMGLIENGQGWFRSNLTTVSAYSGISSEDIRATSRMTILAYATAADSILRMYNRPDPSTGLCKHRIDRYSEEQNTWLILEHLSELPPSQEAVQQFAISSFIFSVMTFMCDESMAGTYGFPQHDYDLKEFFGKTNFNILSSRSVSISRNNVWDENGNIFRTGDGPAVLSADYGPALWNPAASCNYSSRNSIAVSAVTIHTVQGTYAGCISWFQNCAASVSAHYVVRSSDGQITQMVYESLKAWHVGSENPYTIGIEHEGYVNNAAWYTNAMYTNSAALVSDICADYSINPLRTGWWPWLATTYYNQSTIPGSCTRVKGHQHYPNQSHSDPGVNWNWNYFYQLINGTPSVTTYTTATGNFYDTGGFAGDYSDDERVVWTIAPTNATSVTVNFNSFNAENTWDYLYVYDGADISAPLIGYYTGTNNPGTITSSGGSLTFEWRSDCATTAAGWDATWTSQSNTSQADVTAPTTQVNVAGTWQTQNFQATFAESDNAGGSGLEKSYYQVIDFDGSDWRANNSQGFFSDNFDLPTIHPEWTSVTGTWAINNAVLEQNDENLTNTNIYAPLTQNLSNRYLYHWAGKIDGIGTNRRAGFHFFCDNPTLPNRGNSYFVWFRVDQSVCEIYEVVNDVFTLQSSFPMTVNAAQWYDWKVIYDRITGKITVYQDNVYIGNWTDTTPLANGDYVSFRSGNCNWQVNNFKVYRSRADNQPVNVTVGNCGTCELRFENTNPATPAGRIKSIVADTAGNLSAISYIDVNVDWTIPSSVDTVNDGFGTDIDLSTSATQLQGDWSVSVDTNSGLARYWYAIGTNACDSDVVAWTNNWGYDTVTMNSLALITNQWYYFSVRAENGAGLVTPCYSSDGALVDLTTGIYSTASGSINASVGPNPFTETTTINYTMRESGEVNIVMYDQAGRIISLYSGSQAAGHHRLDLNSSDLALASGVYFISIQTNTDQLVMPLIYKK
ncbi:MAG TPA: N-acetylmuramoyl-L-alanine amidase, partial [Bacteroidia bacterium]|nr:N-acetylmuramoyl-L-alanine amidase [Bacteroidia bacterium]